MVQDHMPDNVIDALEKASSKTLFFAWMVEVLTTLTILYLHFKFIFFGKLFWRKKAEPFVFNAMNPFKILILNEISYSNNYFK